MRLPFLVGGRVRVRVRQCGSAGEPPVSARQLEPQGVGLVRQTARTGTPHGTVSVVGDHLQLHPLAARGRAVLRPLLRLREGGAQR